MDKPASGDTSAVELAEALQKVENLENALLSARRIGAAVGIVMASSKLTYDNAFALLVTVSQHSNRKVRQVAEDVILTGELDALPRSDRPSITSAVPARSQAHGLSGRSAKSDALRARASRH